MNRAKSQGRAFTLIELLAVISIVVRVGGTGDRGIGPVAVDAQLLGVHVEFANAGDGGAERVRPTTATILEPFGGMDGGVSGTGWSCQVRRRTGVRRQPTAEMPAMSGG